MKLTLPAPSGNYDPGNEAQMRSSLVFADSQNFKRTDVLQPFNLQPTGVVPGSYTNTNLTVDIYGRLTAATNGATGGGSGLSAHPGFASGRYYWAYGLAPAGVGGVQAANTLYASAFFAPVATTFTKISVYCTATGGAVEMGIYNIANGIPTSLIQDFGSQTLVSGSNELTGLTISLPAGNYALVCAFSATPTIAYGNISTVWWQFGTSSPFGGIPASSWNGSWTYSAGALPSTFPSPTFAGSSTCPIVFLRL